MSPTKWTAPFAAMIAVMASPLAAQSPLTISQARQSLVGRWAGKLEYRDYRANRWFGLPVAVDVRDAGDGVTLIRTADYDDGPTIGVVRITTVSMLSADGRVETSATFRKGREVALTKATLALTKATAADNWTIIEEIDGTDDDRPAKIRLTTIRDRSGFQTLKEVDFSDDAKEEWLVRNRTTLMSARR